MMERIETQRMWGERIEEADRSDLLAMHRDPLLMATLTLDGKPLADDETERRLEKYLDDWTRDGFGLWMFRHQRDKRLVGRGGLRRTAVTGSERVELAYAVLPEFWNRGYASEMALASLRVGFDHLQLDEIVCFTLTSNLASQRVMQKVGLRYQRVFGEIGLPHVLYRLSRDEWLASHSRQ